MRVLVLSKVAKSIGVGKMALDKAKKSFSRRWLKLSSQSHKLVTK